MEQKDYDLSAQMVDYLCHFVRNGNPNGEGLPAWQPTTPTQKQVLTLGEQPTAMKKAPMWKMIRTMLTNKAVGE
jgi:carboxylesterase type B